MMASPLSSFNAATGEVRIYSAVDNMIVFHEFVKVDAERSTDFALYQRLEVAIRLAEIKARDKALVEAYGAAGMAIGKLRNK